MSAPSFSVRSATGNDLAAIVPLLHAQLREHGIPARAEHLTGQVGALLAQPAQGFVLVAEEAGRIVGVAYVTFARPLEHDGEVAWLEELYVAPASRSGGVGGALLADVIARAEARGCVSVDLEVAAEHARAANLYARSGFRSMRRTHYTRPLARWDWASAVVDTDDVNPTGRFSDRAADYAVARSARLRSLVGLRLLRGARAARPFQLDEDLAMFRAAGEQETFAGAHWPTRRKAARSSAHQQRRQHRPSQGRARPLH